MDEIKAALSSPLWWFTALVVGIAASVIAAYVKAFIDRRLQARSVARQERATKKARARERRIAEMRQSDRALLAGVREELTSHVSSVGFYTLSIFLWIQADGAPLIIGVPLRFLVLILFMFGLHAFVQAMKNGEEVSDSLQKQDNTSAPAKAKE